MTYVPLSTLVPSPAARGVNCVVDRVTAAMPGFHATSLSYSLGVCFFGSRRPRR
ncbi:hypothetical protein Q4F19_20725 [Sphingomonas sp. BIUV-7]|uniref:Uncharacterized protein n=1 Tax=Sphingomonas natans TaxID=3063330 RepID=A0ABT8YG63_9SPHN|nr:hypothetical protein [Sphingomonas sp. BIUV-7]MDO6416820.1 hypothetical protein [Sphingomonas sp. BIUV-7]